jgi:hypothetical protein
LGEGATKGFFWRKKQKRTRRGDQTKERKERKGGGKERTPSLLSPPLAKPPEVAKDLTRRWVSLTLREKVESLS